MSLWLWISEYFPIQTDLISQTGYCVNLPRWKSFLYKDSKAWIKFVHFVMQDKFMKLILFLNVLLLIHFVALYSCVFNSYTVCSLNCINYPPLTTSYDYLRLWTDKHNILINLVYISIYLWTKNGVIGSILSSPTSCRGNKVGYTPYNM